MNVSATPTTSTTRGIMRGSSSSSSGGTHHHHHPRSLLSSPRNVHPYLSSPSSSQFVSPSLNFTASSPLVTTSAPMTAVPPILVTSSSTSSSPDRKCQAGSPTREAGSRFCGCHEFINTSSCYSGLREILTSLALMCILSLLMAFLGLSFLHKTTPPVTAMTDDQSSDVRSSGSLSSSPGVTRVSLIVNPKEYNRVSNFSATLSTLTIALNLCCLFVCCIQFLSAVKLLKSVNGGRRTRDFLKKTSHVRITGISAFLISIPIFFTGVILYAFINFDELPALVTSLVIGTGIIFCGLASVHNVYLWQREKTKANKELLLISSLQSSPDHSPSHRMINSHHPPTTSTRKSQGVTFSDQVLNNMSSPLNQTHSLFLPNIELSTLV